MLGLRDKIGRNPGHYARFGWIALADDGNLGRASQHVDAAVKTHQLFRRRNISIAGTDDFIDAR